MTSIDVSDIYDFTSSVVVQVLRDLYNFAPLTRAWCRYERVGRPSVTKYGLASPTIKRGMPALATAFSKYVYMTGGTFSRNAAQAKCERYDLSRDEWTLVP